jgi:hypothetical protein
MRTRQDIRQATTSALPGTLAVQRCHAQVVFADRTEKGWAGSALDLGISGGRALSRSSESRSTEPPRKTASRRIRVTIPPAVAVARSRPLRRASHMRIGPICAYRVPASITVALRGAGDRLERHRDRQDGRPGRALPSAANVCPLSYRTPGRRSSGRGGEAYSPLSFVHDVAGVASAATRACRVGPPLRSGPPARSKAPLRRVPPAPACHDLHVAGGE